MRIAIVNDLRLAVESLKRSVATIPGATVAWIAYDGAEAVALCAQDRPDVVLMDMIMPVMDGVEATRRIMRETPCPILVVTATVEGNSSKVFEALGAGALDAVATPTLASDLSVVGADPLARKIRTIESLTSGTSRAAAAAVPSAPASRGASIARFVAIGASTGGPQALLTLLSSLPAPAPWPIVVVQHVDPTFAPGMTEWLARETRHRVDIIREGDALLPGRVALAATLDHVVLDGMGCLRYVAEPRDAVFRPSVDVFFDSVLAAKAAAGVAVVLTGMGRDGAAALGRLRAARWHTIAQDRATSIVWGMPGAAVELGAAVETIPIDAIGPAIASAMSKAPARLEKP